MMRSSKTK